MNGLAFFLGFWIGGMVATGVFLFIETDPDDQLSLFLKTTPKLTLAILLLGISLWPATLTYSLEKKLRRHS